MPPSPTKRGGASQTSPTRPRGQIIVVSATSTRRSSGTGRGRGRALATPTPSPTKSRKGKEKATEPASPTKSAATAKTPTKSPSKRATAPTENASSDEGARPRRISNNDSDDPDSASDSDSSSIDPKSAPPTLALPELAGDSSIQRTASDVYLYLASKPSRTSSNTFSSLLPHLSSEECTALLASSSSSERTTKHAQFLAALKRQNEAQFDRWLFELIHSGFNLILYGFGSKRELLNDFARAKCTRRGQVVLINAFWSPPPTLRSILDTIEERVPAILEQDLPETSSSTGLEAQTERIYRYFSSSPEGEEDRRLFLVIHNIDYAPTLRNARSKACLALLASNPRIHLVMSVDNIHSVLMWTTGEMLGRKHPSHSSSTSENDAMDVDDGETTSTTRHAATGKIPSSRGFALLWHHTPTYAPYTAELSFRPTSLLPRSSKPSSMPDLFGGEGGQGVEMISEAAARQVLASVTQKAKRLFKLLGEAQLLSSSSSKDGGEEGGGVGAGMPYDLLSIRAREEFLATNDSALRALLTEFRDHGLVVQSAGASEGAGAGGGKVAGDVLWIPLPRDVLPKLMEGL